MKTWGFQPHLGEQSGPLEKYQGYSAFIQGVGSCQRCERSNHKSVILMIFLLIPFFISSHYGKFQIYSKVKKKKFHLIPNTHYLDFTVHISLYLFHNLSSLLFMHYSKVNLRYQDIFS